jgi:hypothetical protein
MSLYNKPQYGTGSDTVAGNLNLAGDLVFSEQVDHSSTPSAGFGYLWTKNTAPTTLIFTDDTGADFTINASAGGWDISDDTYSNYAHGIGALDSIVPSGTVVGNDCIAIGENALTAVTSGRQMVAIGTDAGMTANDAGCTFVGYRADCLASTATNSTAIGALAKAGRDYCTVIGAQAGQSIGSSTDYATCVGAAAGASANDYTTAVGYLALRDGGNASVAVGAEAGMDGKPSYGVLLGHQAGRVTSGQGNIVIGALTGSNITTANRCLLVGYNVDADSTTDPYQVKIGLDDSIPLISGKFGAFSDYDVSTFDLTIRGPSADASASTNLDAGDLILRGGLATTTGAGVGGDVFIRGGTKGSTGTDGDVYLADSDTDGLSFWNATPVAQQSGTGETTGFTAGSGTAVNDDSTFTGNVGSTAYRISDVVKALKNYGLLAS